MIVVDTSALCAIAFDEPERERFLSVMEQSQRVLVSTVSVLETKIVLHARRGPAMVEQAERLLEFPNIAIVPVDAEQAAIAYAAFTRYGKGQRHPASLNLGDLFPYSLAKTRGLPLLFKGEDFAHTDITLAT